MDDPCFALFAHTEYVDLVLLAIFTWLQVTGMDRFRPSIVLLVGMMIGNGLVFGWCSWKLSCGIGQWICVAWLVLNILLTFTDQFGTLDLITLMLDILILSLLLLWMRYGRNQRERS
jgi:hypothetical protein